MLYTLCYCLFVCLFVNCLFGVVLTRDSVLREQWIRAKYERKEFLTESHPAYLSGKVWIYRNETVLQESLGAGRVVWTLDNTGQFA